MAFDTKKVVERIKQKKAPALKMAHRARTGKTGIFLLALATFLLFGLLRYLNQKYIQELISTLSRSSLRRLSTDAKIWQTANLPTLFISIYFLSAGFVVGKMLTHLNWLHTAGLMSWGIGTALVVGTFVLKYFFLQSVAMIFRFRKTANCFFRHTMIVNQLLGYILLPICGLVLLVPTYLMDYLLVMIFVIMLFSLVFKYLINVAYVRNLSKVNYVHFIVYLCVFEFIPLAVIARYAYNSIGV